MNIISIFAAAYCTAVLLLTIFIAFMVHTKRWEIVEVECGETDCDLKCGTCNLLPTLLEKPAD